MFARISFFPQRSSNFLKNSSTFNLLNRRHHCRLCGLLTCQECIKNLKLPLNDPSLIEIKVCRNCHFILGRKKASTTPNPPIVPLYQESLKIKTLILDTLPLFNQKLMDLYQNSTLNTQHPGYIMALETRKRLTLYFSELDKLGKRIKHSPTESLYYQKLQDNIYFSIIQFLQQHMFTLQLLPDGNNNKDKNQIEIETLENEILVLQEQKNQVEKFLLDATAKRRFEDAQMLKESLDELILEIHLKKQQLKEK